LPEVDFQLRAESGEIFSRAGFLGVLHDEAVFGAFGGVGNQNRKYHAGRLAALPAIGPGQDLQHFENQGLWMSFRPWAFLLYFLHHKTEKTLERVQPSHYTQQEVSVEIIE